MLKVRGNYICVPLEIFFKAVLLSGVFSSEWKKRKYPSHSQKVWQTKY